MAPIANPGNWSVHIFFQSFANFVDKSEYTSTLAWLLSFFQTSKVKEQ